MLDRAPAIHVPKKSTHGVCDESRAVFAALEAARCCRQPVPIVFGKKLLGYAMGEGRADGRSAAFYAPPSRMTPLECAWQNYPQIQTSMANGQWIRYQWQKSATTAHSSNQYFDMWPVNGFPNAGTYSGTAGTSRSLTSADFGAMMVGGAVSPSSKQILSFGTSNSGTANQLNILYDRVLTYETCPFGAAVTLSMTNSTSAARYNGAGLSGMQIMVTAQTVLGASNANLNSVTYVNQDGTGGKLMPTTTTVAMFTSAGAPTTALGARIVAPNAGNATVSWWWSIPLANSDMGVRSITNYQTSAANTGSLCFVLARPIAYVFSPILATYVQVDQVVNYTCLETIYDGACLSVIGMGVNNAMTGVHQGELMVGWG